MLMPRLAFSQRSFTAKLIIIGGLITFLLSIYTLHPSSTTLRNSVAGIFTIKHPSECSPELWSSGQWQRRTPPRTYKENVTSIEDVLEMEGFVGCASDREYRWHLGSEEDQWERFPDVASYKWTPPESCNAREFDREDVIRDMVEKGGWLLLGDSVTENHFFSLSCMLYPHVMATPNYTLNPYWDRAWPQNLYLNPNSPLVSYLSPPDGFNISVTPLVTFRRVDLLLSQEHLQEVYHAFNPEKAAQPGFELLGGDQVWELDPSEYMSMFTAPLPEANYGTMVVSSAGHWTVGTFPGLRDETMPGEGIGNVMDFFVQAMRVWAEMTQGWLKGAEGRKLDEKRRGGGVKTKGGRRRQVLIRAYMPGHDGCHNHFQPWTSYEQRDKPLPYNWGQIPGMNKLFQDVLQDKQFTDIHYLDIDTPGLLRPDAHVGSDCLHLMSGSGVIEGWSEYIWHYVTRELAPQHWLRHN